MKGFISVRVIATHSPFRAFLRAPWRKAGVLLAAAGLLGLALYLHLIFFGRVIPGRSARIPARGIPADNGPVLYFYMVRGATYSGWRRGIQWGEQPLAILYSPFWPRIHLTSTNPKLRSPRAWLREPDFLLRLGLCGALLLAGAGLLVFGPRFSRAFGWIRDGFRLPPAY